MFCLHWDPWANTMKPQRKSCSGHGHQWPEPHRIHHPTQPWAWDPFCKVPQWPTRVRWIPTALYTSLHLQNPHESAECFSPQMAPGNFPCPSAPPWCRCQHKHSTIFSASAHFLQENHIYVKLRHPPLKTQANNVEIWKLWRHDSSCQLQLYDFQPSPV